MLLNEKEGKYTHVLCGTIIHPVKKSDWCNKTILSFNVYGIEYFLKYLICKIPFIIVKR